MDIKEAETVYIDCVISLMENYIKSNNLNVPYNVEISNEANIFNGGRAASLRDLINRLEAIKAHRERKNKKGITYVRNNRVQKV